MTFLSLYTHQCAVQFCMGLGLLDCTLWCYDYTSTRCFINSKYSYHFHLSVPCFPVPILTRPSVAPLMRYRNFPSQTTVFIWSLLLMESSDSVKVTSNCQLVIKQDVCRPPRSLNEPFLSYSIAFFSVPPTGSLPNTVLCCWRTSRTWINSWMESLLMKINHIGSVITGIYIGRFVIRYP